MNAAMLGLSKALLLLQLSTAAGLASGRPLRCRSAGSRAPSPRLAQPIDGLKGMDLQRQLGELSFSEVTSERPDSDSIVAGAAPSTTVTPEAVRIGLFYGQLTSGDLAGTRVLIKCYSSAVNNALAAARAEATTADGADRMRERLAAAMGDTTGDERKAEERRLALEALLRSDGMSLAEALAENEYASHCRVQAAASSARELESVLGICRMIGRLRPDFVPGDDALILHAFPWRGQPVRMALPTELPPSLASWAARRERGETAGSAFDRSVPRRAAQERSRFTRAALHGALRGLAALHSCGLLHQSLSPQAVLLSSEDDRIGDKVKGTLTELGFCREARSMALAYRVDADGAELPACDRMPDPLETRHLVPLTPPGRLADDSLMTA